MEIKYRDDGFPYAIVPFMGRELKLTLFSKRTLLAKGIVVLTPDSDADWTLFCSAILKANPKDGRNEDIEIPGATDDKEILASMLEFLKLVGEEDVTVNS